ncbi:hypothetical protein BGZ83_005892 [Gryganskiella cystojenkinii]|nr:hypothetical protein BGZ83_005892 [Gryganskiella cystojenkinii]
MAQHDVANSTPPLVTLSAASPTLSSPSASSTSSISSSSSSVTSMSSPPLSPAPAKSPSSSTTSMTATLPITAVVTPSENNDIPAAPSTSSINSSTTTSTATVQPTRATEAPPKQRSKNGYIGRVGFDTLGCNTRTEYSFTLQARTDRWKRNKHSRTFLIGMDLNEHSAHALKWVMENMVEDGDEVVALRVVPMELRDSFAKTGIPSFHGQEVAARTEAIKIMNMIREKNQQKEINIVVEITVGNIRDTIQNMIKMYEPHMLVVGTKGKNTMRGFLLGSVSRYCLNHSPVPVTVVRPASKLIKSKTKAKGIFRRRTSVFSDSETESEAPQVFFSSPLSRQTSRTSVDYTASGVTGVLTGAMGTADVDLMSAPNVHHHHHHQHKTAGAMSGASTSGSTRPGLFLNSAPLVLPSGAVSPKKQPQGPYSSMPTSPVGPAGSDISAKQMASIHSSLSFASALLSDSPMGKLPPTPPPEGRLKLKKSLTTDGSSPSSSSGKNLSSRRSFGRLSGAMLLGGFSLNRDKKKKQATPATVESGFLSS